MDCKATNDILLKDVKNLSSKQIFARWLGILSIFGVDIEYIKGESNSLSDFLTREFLQGKCKEGAGRIVLLLLPHPKQIQIPFQLLSLITEVGEGDS